jgi:hypothetical protein
LYAEKPFGEHTKFLIIIIIIIIVISLHVLALNTGGAGISTTLFFFVLTCMVKQLPLSW